jgi:hypothetical protein
MRNLVGPSQNNIEAFYYRIDSRNLYSLSFTTMILAYVKVIAFALSFSFGTVRYVNDSGLDFATKLHEQLQTTFLETEQPPVAAKQQPALYTLPYLNIITTTSWSWI